MAKRKDDGMSLGPEKGVSEQEMVRQMRAAQQAKQDRKVTEQMEMLFTRGGKG